MEETYIGLVLGNNFLNDIDDYGKLIQSKNYNIPHKVSYLVYMKLSNELQTQLGFNLKSTLSANLIGKSN